MSTALLDPVHADPALTVCLRAPAKVNLTLDVLGRRNDDFHDLRSLAIGVGLCDDLTAELQPDPDVVVDCSEPTLSAETNLAAVAARRLAEARSVGTGVRIDLKKRIPIGAGLGGGSSDAAAALRACNRLWRCGLEDRELAAIGAQVGSDVPLFFSLPAVIMEGRGERTEAVSVRWSGWALLLFPGFSISTADVYRAWRPADACGRADIDAARRAKTAAELSVLMGNQLEPAVFRVCPALAEFRQMLETESGIGPLQVSGSGSTLFRLFDDRPSAQAAAQRLRDRSPRVSTFIVKAPVSTSWEPFSHEES